MNVQILKAVSTSDHLHFGQTAGCVGRSVSACFCAPHTPPSDPCGRAILRVVGPAPRGGCHCLPAPCHGRFLCWRRCHCQLDSSTAVRWPRPLPLMLAPDSLEWSTAGPAAKAA